ncbi:MAG: hypothetical protein J1F39_07075 [Clostridiales bacterium]|nr:hypothetical protein [Clostridiales bacterium]
MTTLSEMKAIANNVVDELGIIERYMSGYKKLIGIKPVDWGSIQFDAYDFIQEIKEEIKKINLAVSTYTRADLRHIYAKRNFDDYANELRKTLRITQKKLDYFKKHEDTIYYVSIKSIKFD